MERRLACRRAAAVLEPHLHVLRPCVSGQPTSAGAVFVRLVRFRGNADLIGAINGLRRGEALLSGEGQDNAQIACEVNDAVMPPAAGTHGSHSGASLLAG